MKKIFLLLFIFILITFSYSQNMESKGTIVSYTLNPPALKTGEKGFARIRIAENFALPESRKFSIRNNQWFHIDDIKINYEENEILVWFMPLDPSITAFPDFKIQNKLYSGIPLTVKSQLGNVNLISLLDEKLLLPWTKLLFAACFTLLILFLSLCYYIVKVVPENIRKTFILKNAVFKRKQLLKKITKLTNKIKLYEQADYIKQLLKLLKQYLEIVTDKKATCFTTGEMIKEFPDAPSKELLFLDSVRFGNSSADSGTIAEASGSVYNFALMFEEIAGGKKI